MPRGGCRKHINVKLFHIQGPEKIGHDEGSTILPKEDEQMIIANKEKQDNSLIDQVRVPF